MRLAKQTVQFSLCGIPMVGNLDTGGVIGLTTEGHTLCKLMAERDISHKDIPSSCQELVEHLEHGGYLKKDSPRASVPYRIRSAYLHVTQRCNLSCTFCYSEGSDRNALPDPSFEELRTAIDFLVSLGTIRLVISGGEPFMRNDLPELASYAKACGVQQIIILTNGLFISSANVRPLATLVDGIAVAFDGYSEGSGAFLRGEQRFSSLVQAIRIIQQENIEARILPTIHGKNIDDIAHYEKLARELGATVSYSLLLASPHDAGAFLLSDTQLAHLGELSSHGAFSYGSNAYESRMVALSARRSCGAGTRTLSVAADGKVYPCHMLHDKHFYMGNAFRDAPETIMNSTVARYFHMLDVRDLERCNTCEAAYLCGGGCRARAFLHEKSIMGHDPYCRLSYTYYQCLGRQLSDHFRKEEKDAV